MKTLSSSVVPSTLLESLTQELARSINRFGKDADGLYLSLAKPHRLKDEAERISRLFEEGAPPVPPLQQRLQALARLRRGETDLTRRDWILITWGLCDDDGSGAKAIDEPAMFNAVMAHSADWIARRDVPRKGWFGLLNSYFSYDIDTYAETANWLKLRGQLVGTMPILIAGLKRPTLWTRMLETHADIFTNQAGKSLREVVFDGSTAQHEQLETGLPIPESSWLWRRVVSHQIAHLNAMIDPVFLRIIPAMVNFLRTKPLYADEMLAALLTRYYRSGYRDDADEALKQESFARWGNPQLRGAARWAKVEAPVRAMVLRWVAKEDLEHFFSLLQGNGQVDQARLRYWLRFVDQISYTRILLGSDAIKNPHPEFRNFREKNAKRYGNLNGGPTSNNAFIMRIDEQYMVEFSETGNACYAYEEKQMPFDPDAKALHYSFDLKKKIPVSRYADNRILHGGSWEWKADNFLAERGIYPGKVETSRPITVSEYKPKFDVPVHAAVPARPAAPVQAALPEQPAVQVETRNTTSRHTSALFAPTKPAVQVETRLSTTRSSSAALASSKTTPALTPATIVNTIKIASQLAQNDGLTTVNHIDKGGAFWVLTNQPGSVVGRKLTLLGLQFSPGKGFWIK